MELPRAEAHAEREQPRESESAKQRIAKRRQAEPAADNSQGVIHRAERKAQHHRGAELRELERDGNAHLSEKLAAPDQ